MTGHEMKIERKEENIVGDILSQDDVNWDIIHRIMTINRRLVILVVGIEEDLPDEMNAIINKFQEAGHVVLRYPYFTGVSPMIGSLQNKMVDQYAQGCENVGSLIRESDSIIDTICDIEDRINHWMMSTADIYFMCNYDDSAFSDPHATNYIRDLLSTIMDADTAEYDHEVGWLRTVSYIHDYKSPQLPIDTDTLSRNYINCIINAILGQSDKTILNLHPTIVSISTRFDPDKHIGISKGGSIYIHNKALMKLMNDTFPEDSFKEIIECIYRTIKDGDADPLYHTSTCICSIPYAIKLEEFLYASDYVFYEFPDTVINTCLLYEAQLTSYE